MAYISFQPSDFFNALPFVGNGATGHAITGVGFQPDFCWFKNREVANDYWLFDSVRGVEKYIESDTTQIETTATDGLKSFNADGFTVDDANPINHNTKDIISWNWKAGTTSGITGSPSITPSSYSFNQTSGFSIIAYTGNGVAGATIPHGLGVAPSCVLIKATGAANSWLVGFTAIGWTKALNLNSTTAEQTNTTYWNDTAPSSTLVTLGTHDRGNDSGVTYVAYCFTDIKGYSKFGSYIGDGLNGTGTMVYTGFRPAYVVTKNSAGGAENWSCFDYKRLGYNPKNYSVDPNVDIIERTTDDIDLLSNGFKLRQSNSRFNANGYTYVYAAFAEFPIVSSNNLPTVAR